MTAAAEGELPPHVSPDAHAAAAPLAAPTPSHIPLSLRSTRSNFPTPTQLQLGDDGDEDDGGSPTLPALVSPAFTPPPTPRLDELSSLIIQDNERDQAAERQRKQHRRRPPRGSGVSSAVVPTLQPHPKLLPTLPEVDCLVRARIPTTTGQEMFLHLYTNNVDNKEHLAIVFGPHIRSQSLDAVRPGETEMDRMIRGAYTGRLYPGRTTSRAVGPGTLPTVASESAIDGASTATAQISDMSPRSHDPPLVRVHSECYTGETVWSARCDCGEQLDEAARLMSLPVSTATSTPSDSADEHTADANAGPGGVIIYLRQEGRGIGLGEKLKAYNLQDLGSDTVEANLLLRHPADARSYGLATAMLVDLGLGGESGIRLLTNNPDKISAVEGRNKEVQVKERVAMVPLAWRTQGKEGIRSQEVGSYLRTKIEKMGHMMQM